MNLSLFDYDLPAKLIAQSPSAKRDSSRLLVFDRTCKIAQDSYFNQLPSFLDQETLVVVNDSKVYPARLFGKRKTGGKVELLLTKNLGGGRFSALIKPLSKLRVGEDIYIANESCRLIASSESGVATIEFKSAKIPFRLADEIGQTPLPPYIKRERDATTKMDRLRYQSLFAKVRGSCAAPTASLHFTKGLIDRLLAKKIEIVPITLHVGPSVFRPIRAKAVDQERLDSESILISEDAAMKINQARAQSKKIVAIGTTVTRALESQFDRKTNSLKAINGETSLFIKEPFKFNIVDHLVTNFHLPKSSLLLLVAAFATRGDILAQYKRAIANEYRFYSFGDAMLIL
ncbi:MAG: tRNA preQ1(34) S-adenosylmethionine ribosyltransferase-isomerase QueA [Nitrospinota bacterium]